MEEILAQSGEFLLWQRSLSFFFFFNYYFSLPSMSPTFAKPWIFLREKLKREERCEIRFTGAGELLQRLKSQHILKKSSLIDKLSIVLLPRSDYTRNYEFSFSNLAAVVFASFTNSWLIINQVFPFARRCSGVKKIFQKLASSCLMPGLHASTLKLLTNIAEIIWVKIE